MPLYEYQCENCGESFEVMQKFSDEPLTAHEKCGGKVHRLVSAPALQFKGSGWYITDYAKSPSSASNGDAKSGASAESKSSESGSSESKSSPGSESSSSKPASSSGSKASSSDKK
ncbi:MAG: zinc ribbon domain-containing protein [Acidobacteriaceae bacterium]|nr:zinc ribbon domain-containing protein [Acidobacteriaceae bacterium]MBV9500959.1 zinc ribbon domain-containing protein [Acidobacteriaceae bacterium]